MDKFAKRTLTIKNMFNIQLYRRKKSIHSNHQKGMVLVIALILISVMMVVVATSLRWAGAEQTIAGNTRDHEIAFQAAEMGLKACELRLQVFTAKGGGDVSYFYNLHIRPADEYPLAGTSYYWERSASWEIATAATTLASTAMANAYKGPAIIGSGGAQTGNVTIANVVQEPRCIIENYALEPITTEELVEVAPAYRITARGLGQRGTILNPATPVFLQSILRL